LLKWEEIPKQFKDCVELSDEELTVIVDKYLRSRYSDQVIGLTRVSYELGYEDKLSDIFKFIGDSYQQMEVKFIEPDKKDKEVKK